MRNSLQRRITRDTIPSCRRYGPGRITPSDQGNPPGLSSTVIVEPLALLTQATDDRKYATLAAKIISDAEARASACST